MLDGVDHQLDGRLWRVNELILTVEFFQNVVLQRSAKMVPENPFRRAMARYMAQITAAAC